MRAKINKNQKIHLLAGFLVLAAVFIALRAFSSNPSKPQKAEAPASQEVLGASIENARGSASPILPPLPFQKPSREINLKALSAESFTVIDEPSHFVLLEKQPHLKLPIASLTKLMTVFLAYAHLNSDEFIEIRPEDMLNVSPALDFGAGEKIKILNLLNAAVVCSANDAARALANHVQSQTGKNFIDLMNAKALDLNLTETNFSNPLGFDTGENYSSVEDLKKLVQETQKLAVFKNLGKTASVEFNSLSGQAYSCRATNKLAGKNLEIEAIKTGYTPRALGSIIARVKRDGHSLIIIVIGSENREADLLSLAEQAFENFDWR